MLTSRIFPRYEVEPSAAIAKREHMLAINYRLGDKGPRLGCNRNGGPNHWRGDVDRRQALAAALDRRDAWLWLPDRTGTSLSSGGDIEFGAMVGAAGFRRLYVPELRLEHCIPAGRVRMDYFKRLVVSVVRSHLTVTHRYPPRAWTTRDRLRAIVRYGASALARRYSCSARRLAGGLAD